MRDLRSMSEVQSNGSRKLRKLGLLTVAIPMTTMAWYHGTIRQHEARYWVLVEFVQIKGTASEGNLLDKGAGGKRLNAVTELRQK